MRVAVIEVDLRLIPNVGTEAKESYWDGDVWVETERRYDLSVIREALCFPSSWHFLKAPQRAVWLNPLWGRLMIAIESESFPEVPLGEDAPRLNPVVISVYDETTGKSTHHLDHFDMYEVDALRKRVEVAQS